MTAVNSKGSTPAIPLPAKLFLKDLKVYCVAKNDILVPDTYTRQYEAAFLTAEQPLTELLEAGPWSGEAYIQRQVSYLDKIMTEQFQEKLKSFLEWKQRMTEASNLPKTEPVKAWFAQQTPPEQSRIRLQSKITEKIIWTFGLELESFV